MERINEEPVAEVEVGREAKGGFFAGVGEAIKKSLRGREGVDSPIYDAAVFALCFLFARCHLVFGAYPIAIGVIAILPTRVWSAVLGAVTGALTLGAPGVIYAIISVIVAFLRVIISATDKKKTESQESTIFREGLILRMSVALIGGFIAAVYEVLLNSFTTESVLFGAAMVILPPVIALALSGIFGAGITPGAIFLGECDVFRASALGDGGHHTALLFKCSSLFGIFLISISLGAYELLGISAGLVFSGIAALFSARRFGALSGAAVGFVSSVGLSASYSVAFTLAGLAVGALATLPIIPAVLIGGVAASVWGAYVGGIAGFLSLFPEYAIAAAISIPLFKRTKLERTPEEIESAESIAEDMVGTMALSYKSKYSGALDTIEGAFAALSGLSEDSRSREREISREELRRLVTECIGRYFDTEGAHLPGSEEAKEAFISKIDAIVPILARGGRISREDLDMPVHLSLISAGITEAINRAVGIVSEEKFRDSSKDTSAEDFDYLSRLINEARLQDYAEKTLNEELTGKVKGVLYELGISASAVQVYGERRPHFIIAIEDTDGSTISSPALRRAIEDAAGLRLSQSEYYRKGKIALMECGTDVSYTARTASVGAAMSSEGSGDTSLSFKSDEHKYYAIISDGMGSGRDAGSTSGFVTEFLSRTLEFGKGTEVALRLLNNTVKRSRRECSATVDLFSYDLITGEATFHKCGAAPSYIRRGSSLFRIRSRTCPIGLACELDAERIRAELLPGDLVIMFSDGISADGEAPWLIDAISRPSVKAPEALAEAILSAAKKNGADNDDLSVLVTEIGKVTA